MEAEVPTDLVRGRVHLSKLDGRDVEHWVVGVAVRVRDRGRARVGARARVRTRARARVRVNPNPNLCVRQFIPVCVVDEVTQP